MRKVLTAVAAVAAIGAVAMPMGATADHRPGHEKGGGGNPALTIAATPDPILWGGTLTITGRLRGSDNAAKPVELQENPFPFPGPFAPIATATTNAQGDYTFRVKPDAYTDYRVVAKVSPEVTSGTFRSRVRMRINRRVDDHTPAVGQVVVFSGRVGPAHDGQTVYIQRRNKDGLWRTKATTVLVDAGDAYPVNSAYSRDLRINRDGLYRVLVKRDADHLGNTSRRVRLDVP
jgi:hypothetical protein